MSSSGIKAKRDKTRHLWLHQIDGNLSPTRRTDAAPEPSKTRASTVPSKGRQRRRFVIVPLCSRILRSMIVMKAALTARSIANPHDQLDVMLAS